jgi:hypothetical protein
MIVIPADKLDEFWKNIYPDGMTMDRVLAELSDIHMLIDHCSRTYMHFSRGMISKPNTHPEEVISIAEQKEQEEIQVQLEDAVKVISEVYDIPEAELRDCV